MLDSQKGEDRMRKDDVAAQLARVELERSVLSSQIDSMQRRKLELDKEHARLKAKLLAADVSVEPVGDGVRVESYEVAEKDRSVRRPLEGCTICGER